MSTIALILDAHDRSQLEVGAPTFTMFNVWTTNERCRIVNNVHDTRQHVGQGYCDIPLGLQRH